MVNPIFQKTLDWLDAGAPHYLFSMTYSKIQVDEHHLEFCKDIAEQHTLKPDCGTACCIAGFMAEQQGLDFKTIIGFSDVENVALTALSLPERPWEAPTLPIFNPGRAPHDATPAQAAAALRRWRDADFTYDMGFNPWT